MDLADCSSKQKDKHNFAVKSTLPTIVLDHRNISNYQPLEVVDRGSETHLQVGENLIN